MGVPVDDRNGRPTARDFFVSYTASDRTWAEWIAWELEAAGYGVLIQAWDFVPGTNLIALMQEGTAYTRTIAVLSSDYTRSAFANAEWEAAWGADPAGHERRLLVARVADCPRPGLLSGVVSVDLFGQAEAVARKRLLEMVETAVAGSSKPSVAPTFPEGADNVGVPFPTSERRIWRTAFRNPHFAGRQKELALLSELTEDSRVGTTIVTLRGMGGVGKSQIATEHAYRNASRYKIVWRVDMSQGAAIEDQFLLLAEALHVDLPDRDPGHLRDAIDSRLATEQGFLLVLDNAEDVKAVENWLPIVPSDNPARRHIIVTSRRDGFDAIGRVIDIETPRLEDAVAFVTSRINSTEGAALALARELDRLPLALEQACAYIRRSALTVDAYIELFRSRRSEVLAIGVVSGRNTTMATLWDLSLAALSQSTRQLLDISAYLSGSFIPLDLFIRNVDLLPQELARTVGDPLLLTESVSEALDHSLCNRFEEGLQIHSLVQAAIRRHHELARAESNDEGDDEQTTDELLEFTLEMLRADGPRVVFGHPEAWARWAALLPHVLVATSLYDERPLRDLETVRTCSYLLDREAALLQEQGRYLDAESLFRRALSLVERNLDSQHPAAGRALNNLALVLKEMGRQAEALPLARRALEVTEANFGPDDESVGIDMSTVAMILDDLGEYDEADRLAKQALRITVRKLGQHDRAVSSRWNSIGMIALHQGDTKRARICLSHALSIGEEALGPTHLHLAKILENLAAAEAALHNYNEARRLLRRATGIAEANLPDGHPLRLRLRAKMGGSGP
jgi:tetratricopeptide (TPR) repeat protein